MFGVDDEIGRAAADFFGEGRLIGMPGCGILWGRRRTRAARRRGYGGRESGTAVVGAAGRLQGVTTRSQAGMNQNMVKPVHPAMSGWCAAVAVGLLAGSLSAQQAGPTSGPAAKPKPVTFELEDTAKDSRVVNVATGKSRRVTFSKAILRVAIPEDSPAAEVLIISPKQVSIVGKDPGTVQVIFTTEDDEQIVFDVVVALDVRELEAALAQQLPDAKITVKPVKETIIVSGTVPDAAAAEKAVQLAAIFSPSVISNLMVAGVQQVMLRVTIAEVARTASRQLGINGFALGKDFFLSNQISNINPVDISALPGSLVGQPLQFALQAGNAGGNNSLVVGLPRAQMEMFLLAMKQNSLLRILAEPNLTAISGQEASFLAGGELPIPIPQDNNTVTIRYEEFGVQLVFRPTVLSDQRVRLEVSPEVSQLDFARAIVVGGFTIPAFSTRRAQTVVEMVSGQTMAIAGLISDEVRASVNVLPGLGEVPIIGALFRSIQYQREQTELLILVTPELVAPLSPDQVSVIPGKDMTVPNDYQLLFLAELEGSPAAPTSVPSGTMGGPGGSAGDAGSSAAFIGDFGPAAYEENK